MKQDEFCYWLQGYFELTEDPVGVVTVDQVTTIRNHLELVKQCNVNPRLGKDKKNRLVPITGFCAWLDGALDLAPTSAGQVLPDAVLAIKEKLGKEFLHVIDPKTPGDKEELQAVHDGLQKPRPPRPQRPGGNVRC